MPRVLLAGLQMEANSFARGTTTLDDFRAQTFAVGDEIHRDVVGPRSELAGAMDVLAAAGCEFVRPSSAQSGPRPPSRPRSCARSCGSPSRRATGASTAPTSCCTAPPSRRGDDDPEGTLLAALRARLGPDRPIAVSLDHHAHLTRRMLDAVDVVTAYRTCPHTDLYERGAQAGELLAATLAGAIRPVVALARRPMITPADLHDSSRDPFRALMALADAAEADGALAAGVLPVQPWLDVPELGWKAVVTTDGDRALAQRLAERMMDAAWELRHDFLTGAPARRRGRPRRGARRARGRASSATPATRPTPARRATPPCCCAPPSRTAATTASSWPCATRPRPARPTRPASAPTSP